MSAWRGPPGTASGRRTRMASSGPPVRTWPPGMPSSPRASSSWARNRYVPAWHQKTAGLHRSGAKPKWGKGGVGRSAQCGVLAAWARGSPACSSDICMATRVHFLLLFPLPTPLSSICSPSCLLASPPPIHPLPSLPSGISLRFSPNFSFSLLPCLPTGCVFLLLSHPLSRSFPGHAGRPL